MTFAQYLERHPIMQKGPRELTLDKYKNSMMDVEDRLTDEQREAKRLRNIQRMQEWRRARKRQGTPVSADDTA